MPSIDFWRNARFAEPPYIHPKDAGACKDQLLVNWNAKHARSDAADWRTRDSRLHVGLLPVPYGGQLAKTELLLLAFNPGLSIGDYQAEEDKDYRRAVLDLIAQEKSAHFLWLNPQFSTHPGFTYWEKKFRGVAQSIADRKGKDWSYIRVLRDLSKRIGVMQAVPYHSSAAPSSLSNTLPSSQWAKSFARSIPVPKIVLRSNWFWDLGGDDVHTDGNARSASFGPAAKRQIEKLYGL